MGWLAAFRSWWRRFLGEDSGVSNPRQWLIDWVRGADSEAGVSVTGKTALKYAPVWYAVNRICGHVGQLPLVLYAREGDRRKRRAREHPAYQLVKQKPNRFMTACQFKETLQYHALLWGNGRAAIARNVRGDPIELIPMLPDRTKTVLVNDEKWHVVEILAADGTGSTMTRRMRDQDVLHITGLGFDGIVGYSLHELARDSIGLGLASEKHGNRCFRQFAIPGLILEAPPGLFRDDEEARKFLAAFREMHEGLDNVGRTALLREGIKATKLSLTGIEAQWFETRKFQRQDAALWFLLEQILGDDASAAYNSIEQRHMAYLMNCLNRWLVKWEEECNAKLLRERERRQDSHYFKFVTAGLLKSDTKTTYETLAIGISNRFLSVNDAREILDLDAIEGGDEYANPAITPGSPGQTSQAVLNSRGLPKILVDSHGLLKILVDSRKASAGQRMCERQLADLIAVECKRVKAASKQPQAFVRWLDGFYSAGRWPATLARALEAAIADHQGAVELAQAHCAASRYELLHLAGSVKAEQLPEAVCELVSTWPARAKDLAAACFTIYHGETDLEGLDYQGETDVENKD